MSAGKRYKWAKTAIQLCTSFDEASPGPLHVSGISKADPAVVTLDDTTSLGAAGDVGVAKFDSIEGMTELDDATVLFQVIDGTTIRLPNVDSSGYGTFSGTGLLYPGVMSDWCEVTGLNRAGGSSPEIPASTVCSDFAEFEIGLPDFGTVQCDFNYAPLTTIQEAIEDFQESGDMTAIRYSLPKSGGERWVLCFVQQTGEQGQNGGLWTGSMTLRATGKPITVDPS